METVFRAFEFKLDRNDSTAGLCVVGKQFKTWKGGKEEEDWLLVNHLNALCGNPEWTSVISETEFQMSVNDIVSIMIDMDSYQGEFKNKTKQQHIKFNLPKRA
eukprot:543822_1